jgi:predicted ATP-grasp superfamily ATP-dependent carboligase
LLADATWYGTLAAMRDLGSRGVPITLACDELLAPSRWSRYATRVVRIPAGRDLAHQLDFLHRFGAEHPGHVLYPTSDESAWVVSCHREELEPKFHLYSPSAEALATLLDKGRLAKAGEAAGLATPRTWLPSDEAEVERIGREFSGPLFVKSRTQIFARGFKGRRVVERDDLLRTWRTRCLPDTGQFQPGGPLEGAHRPLLQAYYVEAESIFTVDGFMDRAGEMVTLGCRKLLQLPRRLGSGVIFEDAPVPAAVERGLQRLLAQAGFFGVFDAEFMEGEQLLLIDVNPRFYNHMAFEIERGLPLAWLAYLAALGDTSRLAEAMADARSNDAGSSWAYVHRLPLRLQLAAQGLAGAMTGAERRRWQGWIQDRAGRVVDPTRAPGDGLPALADVALHLKKFLRHPRAFVRDLKRPAWDDSGPGAAAPKTGRPA